MVCKQHFTLFLNYFLHCWLVWSSESLGGGGGGGLLVELKCGNQTLEPKGLGTTGLIFSYWLYFISLYAFYGKMFTEF